MSEFSELVAEAEEIIRNVKSSDIPRNEKEEILRSVLLDVGIQTEVVNQWMQ